MSQVSTGQRARLAFAVAGREASDYFRGQVGDAATPMLPGERIRSARRGVALAITAVDRAVLCELLAGTSWEEVAVALGVPEAFARQKYERTFALWSADLPAEGMDATLYGDFTIGLRQDGDPEGTAETLDLWYARHSEPWDENSSRPVSRVLD